MIHLSLPLTKAQGLTSQIELASEVGMALAKIPVFQLAYIMFESRQGALADHFRSAGATALFKSRHLFGSLAMEHADASKTVLLDDEILTLVSAVSEILSLDIYHFSGATKRALISWLHRRHNPRFIDHWQLRDRFDKLFAKIPQSQNSFGLPIGDICAGLDQIAYMLETQLNAVGYSQPASDNHFHTRASNYGWALGISVANMRQTLGEAVATILLERYSCRRPVDSVNPSPSLTNEFTLTECRPLLIDRAICYCPDVDALWHAFYRDALNMSRSSPAAPSIRHDYVQSSVHTILTHLFGETNVQHTVWVGTRKRHEEKDHLVLWDDAAIAVESKAPAAYPLTTNDTDINEKQLQSHVDAEQSAFSGLQQAILLLNALETKPTLRVRVGGKKWTEGTSLIIDTRPYKWKFAIVVSLEDYGPLLFDGSLNLQRETPHVAWGISLHDFEQFIDGLTARGWGPSAFLVYLTQRTQINRDLVAIDELDFAAYFLWNGNLRNVAADQSTGVVKNYAVLFDDLWLYRVGSGAMIRFPEMAEPRLV